MCFFLLIYLFIYISSLWSNKVKKMMLGTVPESRFFGTGLPPGGGQKKTNREL